MITTKFKINETYAGGGEVAGVDFTLLKRRGDTCIFKRSDGWYEVVTLRHTKYRERIIKGRLVETYPKENYRQGEEWDGKIVKTLGRANEIFNYKLDNPHRLNEKTTI